MWISDEPCIQIKVMKRKLLSKTSLAIENDYLGEFLRLQVYRDFSRKFIYVKGLYLSDLLAKNWKYLKLDKYKYQI